MQRRYGSVERWKFLFKAEVSYSSVLHFTLGYRAFLKTLVKLLLQKVCVAQKKKKKRLMSFGKIYNVWYNSFINYFRVMNFYSKAVYG